MANCLRTLKVGLQPKLALRTRCLGGLEQCTVVNNNFQDDECNEIIAVHGKKRWADDDLVHRDVIVRQNFYPVTMVGSVSPMAIMSQDWHRATSPLTLFEKTMIMCADDSKRPQQGTPPPSNKVPLEKLELAFNNLVVWLPQIFTKAQDYTIYDENLVFQNNIRGVTTHGLAAYVRQISLLRLIGHLRFAHVKMDILKITKHPEDGTVRVRWRIKGVSALRFVVKFWQVRDWKTQLDAESNWYDGFSTFYVGPDGRIFKHICDKMMPDEEKEAVNATNNLAAKLALLLGVIPRPSLSDLTAIMAAFDRLQNSSDPHSHHNVN